ncbi:MAG: alpha/beta hydrolase family protein [Actinomycetota bacterium]
MPDSGRLVAALCLIGTLLALPAAAGASDLLDGTASGLVCDRPDGARACTGFLAGSGGVALDVDLRLPDRLPKGRLAPLLVVLHGWGGSKDTAASQTGYPGDEFFADRGYAVMRYSGRGFGLSWGLSTLARLDAEVADLRALVSAVADDTRFAIDPGRVGVTGVSYGGGQTWLIASGSTWTTPGGRGVRVRAVAPVATWSDLVASLLPNGRADPTEVVGAPKLGYLAALFGGGLRREPSRPYPNYDPALAALAVRVAAGEPFEVAGVRDPIVGAGVRELATLRSIAWQRGWLEEVREPSRQVPVLAIQGWTDDLFPAEEALRMFRILRAADPAYPIKLYLGDLGHPRARNKGRDVAAASGLLVDWFDYWLIGRGPAPRFGVTAAEVVAASGQGEVVSGPDLERLADGVTTFSAEGPLVLVAPSAPLSGLPADPLVPLLAGRLIDPLAPTLVDTSGALGLGVIVRRLAEALSPDGFWYLGQGRVRLRATLAGADVQYDAKVWDRSPEGRVQLVDRGTWKYVGAPGTLSIEIPLNGSSWRFRPGHEVLVEVGNVDLPFLRPDNVPSSTIVDEVTVELPTRRRSGAESPASPPGEVRTTAGAPPRPPLGPSSASEHAAPTAGASPTVPAASGTLPVDRVVGARVVRKDAAERPPLALVLAAAILGAAVAAAVIASRLLRSRRL